MNFDIVDLKLFVHLANTKNLTRAAERTNLSLSAASSRIKNLEDKMGLKLLYRHNQGVTLTPEGDTFLRHAGLILQQSDLMHGDLQEYSLGAKGHVRIHANHHASSEYLPDVLRRFRNKNPHVSVDVREHTSREVLDAVLSGVSDVGIASTGLHAGNLEVLPYFEDHAVLLVSAQHPLASRQTIAFEESLNYDFVGIPGARSVDTFLSGSDSGNDRRMRICVQAGSYEAASLMVAANIGISVMPATSARRNARNLGLKIIKLSNEWAACSLQICARSFDQLPRFTRDMVELMIDDIRSANVPTVRLA